MFRRCIEYRPPTLSPLSFVMDLMPTSRRRTAAPIRTRRRTDLYDPREGSEAFRLQSLSVKRALFDVPRTNRFSVLQVTAGTGWFWADAAEHRFAPHDLLFFVPYQHIRIEPDRSADCTLLQFHANFLCVETFHAEAGCSGALFNDPYGPPIVQLDASARADISEIISRMRREYDERQTAFQEALLASMKLLLIIAARRKASLAEGCNMAGAEFRHPVLVELRELIERHYCELHTPADYASLLHMTPKALGRTVRENLGKTLTDLIRERILTHAKWQLLHTLRPVKAVAAELGFQDELYFSRLFKKGTGLSPTLFREFETEIRGGSNLSMTSAHAPILKT